MLKIGFHLSISKEYYKTPLEAVSIGSETVGWEFVKVLRDEYK